MPQSRSKTPPDPYFIEAAAKTLDVLELFHRSEEVRLPEVMERLGLIKSTAFRILYTLEKKRYIERVPGGKSYRRTRRHRIGFTSISNTIPFVADIENGIAAEAERAGVELLLAHHEFDSGKLVRQVDQLLSQEIRLLLCYNPDEYVSHVIADRCGAVRVPVLAVTFPVPEARLFGVNNYRAGLTGGEGFGEQILRKWKGALDLVVILDIPGNSPAQQARITGMVEGLRNKVPVPGSKVLLVHVERGPGSAQQIMREVLVRHSALRRIAVLCYNDLNALGALRAVEETGRSGDVAILSQGGVYDVRQQLRRKASPIWAAVAHFPERFGEKLIPLALRIIRGEQAPTTTYTQHVLLTRSNIGQCYSENIPNRSGADLSPLVADVADGRGY